MSPNAADSALPRDFVILLALTLGFRAWLAAAVPFTGDEAYFYFWGTWPDWGFYDHPPMVGWLLGALQAVSSAQWWLRLPSLLLPLALALIGARWLRREPPLAWAWAASIVLAPAFVWNVAITTDTPLVFFSFLSGLAFLRAARDDDPRYYLLAGVLFGGAFLSKYFSALLGLAFLAHVLLRPSRRKWIGFALLLAGALPAGLLNLWWNSGHCWANIMFNVYNRHGNAGLSWRTPLLYGATMLYVLTPLAFAAWWRGRRELARQWQDAQVRALMLLAFVPLGLFAALSLVKTIGLHWVLSFVPFQLLLALRLLGEAGRRRFLRVLLGFAVLHVALFVTVLSLPLETWRDWRPTQKMYPGIVMTFAPQEVLAPLAPWADDFVFAAGGYSPAVTLSYAAGRYFAVFGRGSSHARHDDILSDFRAFDGRNILIWRRQEPAPGEYAGYFREVELRRYAVRGATYHVVLGRGFDYAAYRDDVLATVRDRYYAVPAWLPMTGCYFCERYFPGMTCRK
jgi:hypothetical protein